jgi:maleylacetate reductase
MAEADVPRIAELAVSSPYANPRPVTRDGVEALLHAAWAGDRPPPLDVAAMPGPHGSVTSH